MKKLTFLLCSLALLLTFNVYCADVVRLQGLESLQIKPPNDLPPGQPYTLNVDLKPEPGVRITHITVLVTTEMVLKVGEPRKVLPGSLVPRSKGTNDPPIPKLEKRPPTKDDSTDGNKELVSVALAPQSPF